MSLSLALSDWMMIVQLIYNINSTEKLEAYPEKVLDSLKAVLPYSAGIFCLTKQAEDHFISERAFGSGLSVAELNNLTECALNMNPYLFSLSLNASGGVFRGPNREQLASPKLTSDSRCLIPQASDRALSFVLSHKGLSLGYIVLFRTGEEQAFVTRDICVLETLKNHIALQLYRLIHLDSLDYGDFNEAFRFRHSLSRFGLSNRELEVLALIHKDVPDLEICDSLSFSKSTFKKHLNHIYEKMQVSNRLALLKLLRQCLLTEGR